MKIILCQIKFIEQFIKLTVIRLMLSFDTEKSTHQMYSSRRFFFGYHHFDFIHGLKCTLLMRYKAIFNDPNANNSTTATLFDGNYCKCNGLCDRVIYYFSRTNKYLTSVFTHLSFANFDQTYYFHFVVSNVHVWQELNASLVYGIFWIVYRKRECFSSFFFLVIDTISIRGRVVWWLQLYLTWITKSKKMANTQHSLFHQQSLTQCSLHSRDKQITRTL